MWKQREKILRRKVMSAYKTIIITWIIAAIIIAFLCLFCGGCQDSFGLRFSPTQEQKQSAELTNQLARKVNVDGTDPLSPASRKLVDGTATSLAYTGRPQVAPNLDEFDTINNQAQDDAVKRPDVAGTMDSALEIGLGIAALMGGAGGIKLAQGIKKIHGKAKAFNEIVSQNDLYKRMASAEEAVRFKKAFAGQTETTRKFVAEARVIDKTRMVTIPKENV